MKNEHVGTGIDILFCICSTIKLRYSSEQNKINNIQSIPANCTNSKTLNYMSVNNLKWENIQIIPKRIEI